MTVSDFEWLTRDELAERLQIPKQTVAQWASQGYGPRYAKFGRHVRYALADVVAWEQSQFTPAD
jgi:excisionase family DNA binding protein